MINYELSEGRRPILSVIIPCFNVRQYLPCLLNQFKSFPMDKIELLLIDDASTDGTAEYIHTLEVEEEIKIHAVYLKKNMGQATARNHGMKLAKGKYLWFFDSDDLMVPDTLSVVLKIIEEEQPDVIFTDLYSFQDREGYCTLESISRTDILTKEHRSMRAKHAVDDDGMMYHFFQDVMMYPPAVVFNKKCIEDLYFPDGKKLEDVIAITKFVSTAQNYYYIPDPLVYYRRRENSTMSTPKLETFIDYSRSMYDVVKFFQTKTLSEQARKQMFLCYTTILRWSLNDMVKLNLLNSEAWKYYAESINMFKSENPYSWIDLSGIVIKSYPVHKTIMTLLFLMSPRIYAKVYKRFLAW